MSVIQEEGSGITNGVYAKKQASKWSESSDLVISLQILQKYILDLQYMTFNYQIFPLQIFYITFKI